MADAAPNPMLGPAKGSPPTLEWIGVERLQVDPAYQRTTDGHKSRASEGFHDTRHRQPTGRERMDIDELIGRLDQATGPSRELDAEIYQVLNPHMAPVPEQYGRFYDPSKTSEVTAQAYFVSGGATGYAGIYTASIDAALTLVPEDTFWRVGHDGEGPDPSLIKAQVGVVQEAGTWVTFRSAVAATAPVALCVAALKARKAAQ